MWLLCRLRDSGVCDVLMSIRDSNVSLSLHEVDYLTLFQFCGMQKISKVNVFLAWIPGHSGIQYNDMVDSIAKDTAHEIYAGILFAPNIVTFADAISLSRRCI